MTRKDADVAAAVEFYDCFKCQKPKLLFAPKKTEVSDMRR